jgi:hypothetical protein
VLVSKNIEIYTVIVTRKMEYLLIFMAGHIIHHLRTQTSLPFAVALGHFQGNLCRTFGEQTRERSLFCVRALLYSSVDCHSTNLPLSSASSTEKCVPKETPHYSSFMPHPAVQL